MGANYFVKKTGSDSNNGQTWANAKLTIQAALNIIPTGGGNQIIVAPGTYFEAGLTPNSAGAAAALINNLRGDYDSTILDGNGQASGVTPGYITIDSSLQSGNKGWNVNNAIAGNNLWKWWNLKNIRVTGAGDGATGQQINMGQVSGGSSNHGVVHDGVICDGSRDFYTGAWVLADGEYIKIINSIIYSRENLAGNFLQYSGSVPTTPFIQYERCILVSATGPVIHIQGDTSYNYRIRFKNCLIMHQPMTGTTDGIFYKTSANGLVTIDLTDCVLIGANELHSGSGANLTLNKTRCKTYYKGASDLSQNPLLPGVPYLMPGSPLIDVNSSNGIFPDLFGTAIQGDADYGAQEYKAGVYPKEPTMILQPGGTIVTGVIGPRILTPISGGAVRRGIGV